jgi:hypothetical protein
MTPFMIAVRNLLDLPHCDRNSSGRLEIVSPAAHLANVECSQKVNALILGHLFDS